MGSKGKRASCWALLIAVQAPILGGEEKPASPPRPLTLAEHTARRIEAELGRLEIDGDFDRATSGLEGLFDQVIAWASEPLPFCETAAALRLVLHLSESDPAHRAPLLRFLRKHRELGATLAFLLREGKERPYEVYAVLEGLRANRERELPLFPALTAAICVVQDGRPFSRKVGDVEVKSLEPLDLFDYFVAHESKTLFDVRTMPAELLVHVVDTTATLPEMKWALEKYSGNTNVGGLFFNVRYDYGPFAGRRTKLSEHPYNLQNILTYGGVCGDQTYFASSVGKSLCIPTAFCLGVEPTSGGHSWVGFLKRRGARQWWTFDIGRYPIHLGLPGKAIDPQTRALVPESHLALSSEVLQYPVISRWFSTAALDAARRLVQLHRSRTPFRPGAFDQEVSGCLKKRRPGGIAGAVSVLELGLRQYPYNPEALLYLAGQEEIVDCFLAGKKSCAEYFVRLLGDRYPEFLIEVFKSFTGILKNGRTGPGELCGIWDVVMARLTDRPDLVAEVRLQQGKLWEEAGDADRVLLAYRDICERYFNDSYCVVPAVVKAQQALLKRGDREGALALTERTWKSIRRPRVKGQVIVPTNWYQVGRKYEDLLRRSGKTGTAAAVKRELDSWSSLPDS